ncbi:hypothetical protein H4R34_005201 [Dimargaris verticillata]|uniref:Uncharacterized protein n=1 Tax=Dimargaris verticillata TaxID=2761393 RepID=A0A9W8B2Q2_9FUNG|nr:hypothetical protein H4R34_005201 [Dimargaris verticillata]
MAEATDWARLTPLVVDQLRLAVRPFSGGLDDHTWSFWHERTTNILAGLLPGASGQVLLSAVKAVLDLAIVLKPSRTPEPVPEVAPIVIEETKAKAQHCSCEACLKGRIEALEHLLQDKDQAEKA